MELDNCPKGCKHETFEYCVNGTHCDKHCVCPCHQCRAEHGPKDDRAATRSKRS